MSQCSKCAHKSKYSQIKKKIKSNGKFGSPQGSSNRAVLWPFHLGFIEDRDFSAQPLPHCSTARPRRSSLNTTSFTSQKFALHISKEGKKAQLRHQMAFQDDRFGDSEGVNPGKCLEVPPHCGSCREELPGITCPPAWEATQTTARSEMPQSEHANEPVNFVQISH